MQVSNPSLKSKLFRWLVVIVSGMAMVSGGLAFYKTYMTALHYQDDLLRQTAALINPTYQRNLDIQSDVEIYVRELGLYVANGQLPMSMRDGFHNVQFGNENYRVYVYSYPTGERIAFAQQTKFRDELAYSGAWNNMLPLLSLIPLLMFMVWLLITRLFQPLNELSQHIEQRQEYLKPLSTHHIPKEVLGFVEAINRLLARISLSMEQQQQFIANAAHELRSPLTALSLQASQLAQCELSIEARQQLNVLQQAIARHYHVSEQLLSLARSQTQSSIIQTTSLSILSMFQLVIQTLYPLAAEKDIDLGIREPCDDVILSIDETALFTIVKNVVENAIRYIPEHGQIDLVLHKTSQHVCIIIEDNGHGIPEMERDKVFEPFYRIATVQHITGSGLGLAIVKNMVSALGGTVSLEDSHYFGQGLKVVFMFPQSMSTEFLQ